MIADLITTPCTLRLRSESGVEDDYGNDVPTETTVETVCELQKQIRRSSEEPEGQGEISDTLWALFLPAGTDVDTSDVVEVDGEMYEMVGEPWPVRHPITGVESHVEASVRRVAGAGSAS
jgi:hypothetical protein